MSPPCCCLAHPAIGSVHSVITVSQIKPADGWSTIQFGRHILHYHGDGTRYIWPESEIWFNIDHSSDKLCIAVRFELEQYLQTSLHQGITQISGYQFWTLASPVVEFQLGRYTVSNPIYLDIALAKICSDVWGAPHSSKVRMVKCGPSTDSSHPTHS